MKYEEEWILERLSLQAKGMRNYREDEGLLKRFSAKRKPIEKLLITQISEDEKVLSLQKVGHNGLGIGL